jgi:hypothetical protein
VVRTADSAFSFPPIGATLRAADDEICAIRRTSQGAIMISRRLLFLMLSSTALWVPSAGQAKVNVDIEIAPPVAVYEAPPPPRAGYIFMTRITVLALLCLVLAGCVVVPEHEYGNDNQYRYGYHSYHHGYNRDGYGYREHGG